jgi:hypothetical protein
MDRVDPNASLELKIEKLKKKFFVWERGSPLNVEKSEVI